MPKTKNLFDWEIFENGECVDVLSMTRREMDKFKQLHPEYIIKELGYTNDRNNSTSEIDSKKGGPVYRICVPRK